MLEELLSAIKLKVVSLQLHLKRTQARVYFVNFENFFNTSFLQNTSRTNVSNMSYPEHFLFHDGGRYHKETSSMICYADQWIVFYMTGNYVMKELISRNSSWRIII